jgi:hypothetical protein
VELMGNDRRRAPTTIAPAKLKRMIRDGERSLPLSLTSSFLFLFSGSCNEKIPFERKLKVSVLLLHKKIIQSFYHGASHADNKKRNLSTWRDGSTPGGIERKGYAKNLK